MHRKPKAIALLSGGLDSALAAVIIQRLGVDVVGLHLSSPFGCHEKVEEMAKKLNIPLMIKDKGESYLDLVKNPKYGYGKNMNPCIDCRIYMFQIADHIREQEQADFIVTGEVLGQRPMSQVRSSLKIIDKQSEIEDRVLRPLSARLFPETLPERQGWTPREELFRISGRARREQLELAEKYGLEDYSAPGGGCLLTESGFSEKLREFFEHDESETGRMQHAKLLRIGRHFRLPSRLKVIVGRNETDNLLLDDEWSTSHGVLFHPIGFDGPSALALGTVSESERQLIGSLISRYGKTQGQDTGKITFRSHQESGEFPAPIPLNEEELSQLRV